MLREAISKHPDTYQQPQPLEPQDPELQPPAPEIGFAVLIENPDLLPASIKSTVTAPHCSESSFEINKVRDSAVVTRSSCFFSSRARPRDGPEQPPGITAIRRGEVRLFWSRYSCSFSWAGALIVIMAMLFPFSQFLNDTRPHVSMRQGTTCCEAQTITLCAKESTWTSL